MVTISQEERLLHDTDKNIIARAITKAQNGWDVISRSPSLSTCSFILLRADENDPLVHTVYNIHTRTHIYGTKMVGIKEQGFATHCSSVSTHLSIRCGGARVSPEGKGKAGVFFCPSVNWMGLFAVQWDRQPKKKGTPRRASTARRK
jgi:hypothetical protein